MLFFVCKQKKSYEMRISDWSSDVCSSDLERLTEVVLTPATRAASATHPVRASTPRNTRVRATVHPSSRMRSPGIRGFAALLPSRLREGPGEGLSGSSPSLEIATARPRDTCPKIGRAHV